MDKQTDGHRKKLASDISYENTFMLIGVGFDMEFTLELKNMFVFN